MLALAAAFFLVYSGQGASADKWKKTDIANFMFDSRAGIVEIKFVTKKFLTTGRGFPVAEKNIGLSLVQVDTGMELARLASDEKDAGELLGAYPLDKERIVCNFRHDSKGHRTYHTGVWDIRTNMLRLYRNTGSGYEDEISAVHPEESKIIACPYSPQGASFHDVKTNSKKEIFGGLHVQCPRFSPHGSFFALFAMDYYGKDHKNYLIIEAMNAAKNYTLEFRKNEGENSAPYGKVLSWSPSGKYLAGIVRHDFVKEKLYIWRPDGEVLAVIPLPFDTIRRWAPVWLPNEKDVLVFYEEADRVVYRSFNIFKKEGK